MKHLAALVLILLCLGLSAAQEPTAPTISPALIEQLDDLEAYASRVRGLSSLEAVERRFPSRDETAAFLRGQFADPEILAYYADAELVYKTFELLEPDVDLISAFGELLESQIGGFYDTDTKQMNTLLISADELGDRLPLLEQIVYVHEFVHALQDQHYNLDSVIGSVAEQAANPDGSLAVTSLIEGDATQAMLEFVTLLTAEDPQAVLDELGAIMEMSSTLEIPPGTPQILADELTFPYLQGQGFVAAIIAANGLNAVNQAFENPPVSSEQIIDPQKYLSGDMPIPVELSSALEALGGGWVERFDRTAGEFFIRRVLDLHLDRRQVTFAAGGWGGDRYRFYTNAETGDAAYLWKLTWDSPRDADQFAEAYQAWGASRYAADADSAGCWQDTASAMCYVQLSTGGDSLIARAPDIQTAQAMIDAGR